MSTNFYQLPLGLVDQLSSKIPLSGRILIPCDQDSQLASHLHRLHLACDTHERGMHIFDPIWWQSRIDKYDWIIANTTGLKDETQYILDYGVIAAKEGVIILDRLSFLEPVTKRKQFLIKNKLSDLLIFSPRPRFSTISKARDSVTSAWFVFKRPEDWFDGTNIEYLVDWQAVPPLQKNQSDQS